MAHSEKYKDAQGVQKDRTIWVDCAYWTDRTAIAPYLKKERRFMQKVILMCVRTPATTVKRRCTYIARVSNVQLLAAGPVVKEGRGGQSYGQPAGNYAGAPMAASASVAF